MMSATGATVQDVEALLRVTAARNILTAIAEGRVMPTPTLLRHLAAVLTCAAAHQAAADLEREVAA
jgi:hypothetical protein